jgi:hypothetical protein
MLYKIFFGHFTEHGKVKEEENKVKRKTETVKLLEGHPQSSMRLGTYFILDINID